MTIMLDHIQKLILSIFAYSLLMISITLIWDGVYSNLSAQASPTHKEFYQFVEEWGKYGFGNGQFIFPAGIALDSEENILVTDINRSQIQKFDRFGNFLTKFWINATEERQFHYPASVTIDSFDNIYVADSTYGIIKFDSKGNLIETWYSYNESPEGIYTGEPYVERSQSILPLGISVDSHDNIYATVFDSVLKFDSNGNYIDKWGSFGTGEGQFISPEGLAIDSHDNIYVADHNLSRIQKFDTVGNFVKMWTYSNHKASNSVYLDLLGVDSKDNIYLADANNNRIQKYDSDGGFLSEWGSYGTNRGEFDELGGIAIDTTGKVFVVDSGNSRIQLFSPSNNSVSLEKDNSEEINRIRTPAGITDAL